MVIYIIVNKHIRDTFATNVRIEIRIQYSVISSTIFRKINGVMYNGIADKIRFQNIKQRVPRSSQNSIQIK